MTLTLTSKQQEAVDAAVDCIQGITPGGIYRIGGCAGAGKTTIAKRIIANANVLGGDLCMPCAFTGKAANVLSSKGIPNAQTIHATIYRYDDELEQFVLKLRGDLEGDWFLVDEASMIDGGLWQDLQSFGLPIIAIGDPGQLPPVSPNDPNLMHKPDLVLDEIHRQARGSDIIDFATFVRTKDLDSEWPQYDGKEVEIGGWDDFDNSGLPDITIVGRNATRVGLNIQLRDVLGMPQQHDRFAPGERIICKRNDRKLGVFNGMMGKVVDLLSEGSKTSSVQVLWDGEDDSRRMRLSHLAIGRAERLEWADTKPLYGKAAVVDHAYAITCHAAQGSQWDTVYVVNEQGRWDQRRWLYTAATRAAKKLRIYR